MSTPEGRVKDKVRAIFKAHNVHYTHIPANQFSKGGAPDYVCCVKGVYLAVEVKTVKGKMSELQKIERDKTKEAGGFYIVVNEECLKALEELIKGIHAHIQHKDFIHVGPFFSGENYD